MRTAFQEDLGRIADGLVDMTHLVASAISRATNALLDADLALAQTVIEQDDIIDAQRADLDELCFDVLARQSPVATDLRIVVTALRMSSDIERMGDLARHVAKVARLRYPESAVPAEFRGTLRDMGQVAGRIIERTSSIIAARDVEGARAIDREDDAMDDLHRELYARINAPGWEHGTEAAVDLTLLGRYYERFGDHAVSVAHRVIYLVTGEYDGEVDSEVADPRPAVD